MFIYHTISLTPWLLDFFLCTISAHDYPFSCSPSMRQHRLYNSHSEEVLLFALSGSILYFTDQVKTNSQLQYVDVPPHLETTVTQLWGALNRKYTDLCPSLAQSVSFLA